MSMHLFGKTDVSDIALSNKNYVIVGEFNVYAPFWENGCT